ncbi:MAG: hypothetical protein H6Q20_1881 [Bacteroidetes bacterium]|nr:hypothetical protein [Bacteroidota bacterium]
MKPQKKDVANFLKLTKNEMKKINGEKKSRLYYKMER